MGCIRKEGNVSNPISFERCPEKFSKMPVVVWLHLEPSFEIIPDLDTLDWLAIWFFFSKINIRHLKKSSVFKPKRRLKFENLNETSKSASFVKV